MADPGRRSATYDDILALPRHVVGQIVFGVLHAHPRPAPFDAIELELGLLWAR